MSTSRLRPRCLSVLLTALLLWGGLPTASAQPQRAVRADTLYTMTGDPIEEGVVLIENETIAAVGPASEVDVPASAEVHEASVVTPGLIDPRGTVGLSGIYNVPADQDQLDTSEPMQPALRALDAYNPREQLVSFVQQLGFTTVHTGHAPGALISGQTATFSTAGTTVEASLRDSITTVAFTLGPDAQARFESPGTRAKGVAMLRQALHDAQAAMNGGEPEGGDLGQDVLQDVLRGEVPALITAHRAHDIQTALRLQEEFGFDLILDGAAEAYLMTEEIAEADVPVILHPTMARPSGTTQNAAFTTAGVLHDAGVPVAIQTGWEPYVPKTRIALYEAAIAMAHGLPREAALASITREAAEILGLESVGTVAPGQRADLALFDGDPFEYTTHVCTVLSGGEVVSDECK
ncbi:amidohydrolase family protein [Salinibacter ruber]|uniref:amidohydrolase family protein n=1 Tax=Salinibacter ruber TaxID=146919 RepID=UPI0020736F0E|nr:amidohydrolase family protein [Salinibacter ruber]MCS4041284.1 imidazolonepropionase-like amidohydrolase [Salinibacter ruber]MCS4133402.1 imidazolonepropionase-like amidohydrolase [Salinibacter ruber]